jgi:hypothetical protein
MMAAIVAPVGCSRRASTDSCFVLPRAEAGATFLAFTGLFALLVPARFVLFDVLRCDILDSFGVATASGAATTAAPQWRYRQWGRIRDGQGPHQRNDTDALFAAEVQSFLRRHSQIEPGVSTL